MPIYLKHLLQPLPTTQFYWGSALVAALLDLGLIWLLTKQISPDRFHQLLKYLVGVAALFWALLYSTALYAFWLPCYQFSLAGYGGLFQSTVSPSASWLSCFGGWLNVCLPTRSSVSLFWADSNPFLDTFSGSIALTY